MSTAIKKGGMKKGYKKIVCTDCKNWYFFTQKTLTKHMINYHNQTNHI